MSKVISMADFAKPHPAAPLNPIAQALDNLALALASHGHTWTDRERLLYETAISYCGYTDSGSSA